MSKIINEGIKFGEKEISDILSRSNDFNIGIEYEIRVYGEQKDDLSSYLEDYGLSSHIDRVIPEHDDMTEIITEKMSLSDAIKHIKGMFKLIEDKEIEIPEMAGLHISISTNKYNLEEFNKATNIIKNVLWSMYVRTLTDTVISIIEDEIVTSVYDKYQTVNISEYNIRNGRIELRFFGGENYHTMFDNIKTYLLRSLFLLEIGYTDLYKKEYYKQLSKFLDSDQEYEKYYSKEDIKEIKTSIIKKDATRLMKTLIAPINPMKHQDRNGRKIFNTLPGILKSNIIKILKSDGRMAMIFAKRMLLGQFPEAEHTFAKSPVLAVQYAELIEDRFKQAEKVIFNDPEYASDYVFMLSSDNLLDQSELADMLIEFPPETLKTFFKDTLSVASQYSLSFNELSSSVVGSGDRELVETMVNVYMEESAPESILNAVIVSNDYHRKYTDDKPLLTRDQLFDVLKNDDLIDVPAFNYSTLVIFTTVKTIIYPR